MGALCPGAAGPGNLNESVRRRRHATRVPLGLTIVLRGFQSRWPPGRRRPGPGPGAGPPRARARAPGPTFYSRQKLFLGACCCSIISVEQWAHRQDAGQHERQRPHAEDATGLCASCCEAPFAVYRPYRGTTQSSRAGAGCRTP